jgi:FG-GAP-like repeat/Cep192 domain 4/Abnormal spindle-like microcephaly-assoc'd, ASPM-SPD-2-Hydin
MMKGLQRGLRWVASLALVLVSIPGWVVVASAQSNPAPYVSQPLVPDAVPPGSQSFTLTVRGAGFVNGSTVAWNGSPRSTTFVSSSRLAATINASDIAKPGTAAVTVVNPAPGGGTSNTVFLPVTSYSAFALTRTDLPVNPYEGSLVAAADFNGDGKPDILVADGEGDISVLLGNGDGTFSPPVSSGGSTKVIACAMAVGDFNGDGILDVAFSGDSTLGIFLGNGDGTFRFLTTVAATGDYTDSIMAADLNGDGKLDLATVNPQSDDVEVFLGNGDGTFDGVAQYSTGGSDSVALGLGDFNRDGKIDLVAGSLGGTVSILFGNGEGGFAAPVQYQVGFQVDFVTAADLNGDGALDLVAANAGATTISVLLGNGDGTFQPPVEYAVGTDPLTIAVGDFDGDRKLDLAVANRDCTGQGCGTGSISVLIGGGNGTFQTHVDYATANSPFSLAIADFNRDGRLDIAVSDANDSLVSVFFQAPAPTLSPTSLTFPTVVVGKTASARVSLKNTGGALDITSISTTGDFSQTTTCGSTVYAGQTCYIVVDFTPKARGTRIGTLSVTDNAVGNPQVVSLSGVGTVVSLSTTSLDFGLVPVGTTSPPMSVTVTNHSSTALNINSIYIKGQASLDFAQTNTCGSSVPGNGSCSINVTFTPSSGGNRTSTLYVSTDGGGPAQTVKLSGYGTTNR